MHPTHTPASDTAPMRHTVADTLRRAADYLTRHGWTQDQYYAHTDLRSLDFPAADVIGAITLAVTGQRFDYPADIATTCGPDAFQEHRRAVACLANWLDADQSDLWPGHLNANDYPHLVAAWNDAPEQDAPGIIDTL